MPVIEKKILKIHLNSFLFLLILTVGIYFRLYNYPDRISMGLDSARDAFVSLYGAQTKQLPLTGPFISIAPVTTGPWYWIQLILFRMILPTPYAPWLLLAFYSILMICFMKKTGDLLEGQKFGLILAFITAFSPKQITSAVGLTNPAVIGFYASVIFYLFIHLLKNGPDDRKAILLGLTMGITFNTHYQAFGLLSLPLSLILFRKKYLRNLIFVFVSILFTFIPLLVFELNNHWFNSRGILKYLIIDQYKIWTPMRWLTYVSEYWPDFMSTVLGGGRQFGLLIMAMILVTFLGLLVKRNIRIYQILLLASFAVEVVIIRYYRGERYFGYLQFFHPYIILFTGSVIFFMLKNRFRTALGLIILLFYLYNVLPSSIAAMTPEPLTADSRKIIRELKEKSGPGPYKFYRCQDLVKPEINALLLSLYMDNMYNDDGSPLLYYWGCQYPDLSVNGKKVTAEVNKIENVNFPGIDRLRDARAATGEAMLRSGWRETTLKDAYQSAARWWFDEQP